MTDHGHAPQAYVEWLEAQHKALEIVTGADTASERERAEGVRYVSRLTALALAMYVENSDPLVPRLDRNLDEYSRKFACDNPDTLYWRAPISADQSYRLWGSLGRSPYTAIALEVDLFGDSEGIKGTVAQYLAEDYETSPDHRFELILSRERRAGNWIGIPEGVTNLLIRQTFLDPRDRDTGLLYLERISGAVTSRPPLGEEALSRGLRQASRFLVGCIAMFKTMSDTWRQANTNRFGYSGASADGKSRSGADPHVDYFQGAWRIAADEALVIRFRPPPRYRLWSFMLCNNWTESLDYVSRGNVSTNSHHSAPGPDGKVTLIVAHRDPGHPGWISTDGQGEGLMLLRWVLAEDRPEQPEVSLVKIVSLA